MMDVANSVTSVVRILLRSSSRHALVRDDPSAERTATAASIIEKIDSGICHERSDASPVDERSEALVLHKQVAKMKACADTDKLTMIP